MIRFTIPPKWIVGSKTFILNALLLSVALIEFFSGHPAIAEHPELATLFVSLGVVLNWIVRRITFQPVTILPPTEKVTIAVQEIPKKDSGP